MFFVLFSYSPMPHCGCGCQRVCFFSQNGSGPGMGLDSMAKLNSNSLFANGSHSTLTCYIYSFLIAVNYMVLGQVIDILHSSIGPVDTKKQTTLSRVVF